MGGDQVSALALWQKGDGGGFVKAVEGKLLYLYLRQSLFIAIVGERGLQLLLTIHSC
jgi:hypothetical protein